jgi:hypothetical protein
LGQKIDQAALPGWALARERNGLVQSVLEKHNKEMEDDYDK